MKQRYVLFVILFAVLFVAGCLESSLSFEIQFEDVDGLKQDDPIYFENNLVGQVGEITYTKKGDYLVDITINQEFKNAATVDSKFFIIKDPGDEQGRAVAIFQEKPGGELLTSDAVVKGSAGSLYLTEMMSKLKKQAGSAETEMRQTIDRWKQSLGETSQELNSELEETLEEMSGRFQEYSEEIQKVPDSEEMKQLEESVKKFTEEFNKSQQDVRDHLREEVIPQLQKELDKLREKLRGEGREKEIEKIDRNLRETVYI